MKLCGLKLVLALAVSPIFSITTLAGVDQCKPRCRYGNVHVVNNLLTGDASITNGTDVLGISAGHMCTVRTVNEVLQTGLDTQNLSKGLHPGVYLVKASGSGKVRQFFIVAK